MSRIGKRPIHLPEGVSIEVKEHSTLIKGPKGEVEIHLPSDVKIVLEDKVAHVEPILEADEDAIQGSENHGTTAAILHNAVVGVSEGWKKELEVAGTGYRCSMKGDTLTMFLGYSHQVTVKAIGKYTKITCPDETHIVVEGVDRQEVGQTAATIYDKHRPDVYGNKGVHYKGQKLIKKVGKRAAAGGKK